MEISNKNILVVIAHPDDETIGCGGFIHKACMQNANCRVLLPIRRGDPRGVENWDKLIQQLRNACQTLGAELVVTEETVIDLIADISIHQLYRSIDTHVQWADIVLTHWQGDSHQAHRALYRAVELATRPFRTRKPVLFFEIATSTDQAFIYTFSPNFFVGLSTVSVNAKTTAMESYLTETEYGRTPLQLENLMRLRGAQAGLDFAEAFMIARHYLT